MVYWAVVWPEITLQSTCMCAKFFSCVLLFATLWSVAPQAPLSMGFSRQEYWSGLSCPPPRDLPDPGTEPTSLMPLALADGLFTTKATRKADGQLASKKVRGLPKFSELGSNLKTVICPTKMFL